MPTLVDPLLRKHEVCDMLRISPASLYRRVQDGTLPRPVKLGGLSRWPQSEIVAALKAAGEGRRR